MYSSCNSYDEFKNNFESHQKKMRDISEAAVFSSTPALRNLSERLRDRNPVLLVHRCEECQKDYKNHEGLRKHFLKHLIRKVDLEHEYPCRRKDCNRVFKSSSERDNHKMDHHKLRQPVDPNLERIRKLMGNLRTNDE